MRVDEPPGDEDEDDDADADGRVVEVVAGDGEGVGQVEHNGGVEGVEQGNDVDDLAVR